MITYYALDHGGVPIGLARVVEDSVSRRTRGFFADRRTSSWVERVSIVGRVMGVGGDADYYLVDRRLALELLRALGNAPDDLDSMPSH